MRIEKLEKNQIFVFGSNLSGMHLAGAAKQAMDNFGTIWYKAEGLAGRSYAFPTLNEKLEKRSFVDLVKSTKRLYKCAQDNPNKEFLLTAIGTGIAGYEEWFMERIFNQAGEMPKNIKRV